MCAAIVGLMGLGVFTASIAPAEPSCIHRCVVDPIPRPTQTLPATTSTRERFTLVGVAPERE